jgi:hypothetical protein
MITLKRPSPVHLGRFLIMPRTNPFRHLGAERAGLACVDPERCAKFMQSNDSTNARKAKGHRAGHVRAPESHDLNTVGMHRL